MSKVRIACLFILAFIAGFQFTIWTLVPSAQRTTQAALDTIAKWKAASEEWEASSNHWERDAKKCMELVRR
jgi:hypothetical protein